MHATLALLLALVLAALTPATSAQPDTLAGPWDGTISVGTVALTITVTFSDDDPPTATIDIPQQGAMGLPLQNVVYAPPSVTFELQAGPGLARFDGTHDGNTITGSFTQGPATGTFELSRQGGDEAALPDDSAETEPAPAELPDGVSAEEVVLTTETGTLRGTLTWPTEGGSVPGVLMVSGSGPTDRDGNSAMLPGKNNSLRMLAEALSAEGYAVLRVDKRGVGGSAEAGIAETEMRVQVYVNDLVAWAAWLRDDLRATDVQTVLGHSEGGLIGALAADSVKADAFVALAGLGSPMQDVLRRQLAAQLTPELLAETDRILASLADGTPTDDVPPALAPVFRPGIQPYLISMIAYDPAEVIAEFGSPVLVVNGTTDVQIAVEDGERLAEAENAELVVIEGMNHVLKAIEGPLPAQLPSYGDPALPLHPELVPAISAFLSEVE